MVTINDKLKFEIQSMFDATGFKQFLSSLKSLSNVAKSMGTELGTNLDDKISDAFNGINDAAKQSKDAIEGTGDASAESAKKGKGEIKSWSDAWNKFKSGYEFGFLSMMFIGQQFSRQIKMVIMKTVALFVQFTQNTSEASQAVSALGANMTMLKFTIGEALATALLPLLPTIIDIIEKITDWIEQNPELTAQIILTSFAIFTLMAMLGTTYMLIKGILGVGDTFKLLWTGISKAMAGNAVTIGSVAYWLGILILLAMVVYAAWKNNIGGLKDTVTGLLEALKLTIGGALKDIGKLFTDIFEFIEGVVSGDFDKMSNAFIKFFLHLGVGLWRLAVNLGSIVLKLLGGLADLALGLFNSLIKLIAGFIMRSAQELAKLLVEPIANAYNWLREKMGKEPIEFDFEVSKENIDKISNNVMEGIKDTDITGGFRFNALIDTEKLKRMNEDFDVLQEEISNFGNSVSTSVSTASEAIGGSTGLAGNVALANEQITGPGGLVPSLDMANDSLFGPAGIDKAIMGVNEQISGADGLSANFNDLIGQLAETGGFNDSVAMASQKMMGNEGLSAAMLNVSDITQNNLIPTTDDMIDRNYALADSYEAAARAAREYASALREKSRARQEEEDIEDEIYRQGGL